MSAECGAQCNAKVSAKVQCTPASVSLVVKGAVDVDAANKLKASIEANLPAVLKVAIGMKDNAIRAAGSVKDVVGGLQGSLKAMSSGGPKAAAKVTLCIGAPFKGAIDAAGKISANVDVSVNVQASASASGSASAGK
jgi:hypothetical protein